jgi:hypothetical protein
MCGWVDSRNPRGSRSPSERREYITPNEISISQQAGDIEGDGIPGKDFLQKIKAQICYESRRVRCKWNNYSFEKPLINSKAIEDKGKNVRTITLQKRSDTIVQVAVDCEDGQKEGLIEKCELKTGVYVANSLLPSETGMH